MEHFKRGTAQDFRINSATLEAALTQESSDEEEEHDNENDDQQNEVNNDVYVYTTHFLQYSFFCQSVLILKRKNNNTSMIDSSRSRPTTLWSCYLLIGQFY